MYVGFIRLGGKHLYLLDPMQSKLCALNSLSSCLSLASARVTGISHYYLAETPQSNPRSDKNAHEGQQDRWLSESKYPTPCLLDPWVCMVKGDQTCVGLRVSDFHVHGPAHTSQDEHDAHVGTDEQIHFLQS